MFIGYKLSPESRNKLLEYFPPKYPKVICHHITYAFGVSKQTPLPPDPNNVKVIGYIDSEDGVEGLLCSVDGTTERPDGGKYHITLSVNNDRKSVETNDFIDTAEDIDPIVITATTYTE